MRIPTLSLLFLSLPLGLLAHRGHQDDHVASAQDMRFVENKGQWPGHVLYRALIPGGGVFVEQGAFTCVVRSGGPQHGQAPAAHGEDPLLQHAYRVHFENGRAVGHDGYRRSAHHENHFIGNDPARWGRKAAVYGGVELHGVYPGIDLRVGGSGSLKYDWIVAPGADPSTIVMRYEGQDGLALEGGMLRVHTSAGVVTEGVPVAWQEVGGARIPVRCVYALEGDRLRFELPDGYDPDHTLVIDPTVVFSSFSGSFADNWGFTATYDETGHLYGGGIALGAGYPITLGAYDPDFNGGNHDISISKFSPDGTTLIWSTYLGGSGGECPHSLIVNDADELYILGTTGSSDFPTTPGAFSTTFGFGPFETMGNWYGFTHTNGTDLIVVRLNAAGTDLLGSTFVGGSMSDGLNSAQPTAYNYGDHFRGEIILDLEQRPLIATSTSSTDMPITPGAPFPTYGGGVQDGYLFCMQPDLDAMVWATYYGGSNADACYGLQVASDGIIYVTGGSNSVDLPMAGDPFDGTPNGGVDGYIARFAADGSELLSSTYLGTALYDQTYFVQLDTTGAVYALGQTRGPYPVSPGVYADPGSSQFIHKLSNDLSTSFWSTRIGNGTGTEDLSPTAFLVSDCKQIYISGWGGITNNNGQPNQSTTFNFPLTGDALQSTTNGSDFYLMVLNPEAVSLAYGSYFGGGVSNEHVDGGTSRFDKNGTVYQAVCAGCGGSSALPTSPGAWSNTNNSTNCNLGVFKIDFEQAVVAAISGDLTACDPATIDFVNSSSGVEWIWDFGDGSPTFNGQQAQHTYPGPGTYTVTLVALDPTACNLADTTTATVEVLPSVPPEVSFIMVQDDPCAPFTVQFTNTTEGSGLSYQWVFSDGTFFGTQNATHTFPGPGTYTVTLTVSEPLCNASAGLEMPVVLEEPPPLEAFFSSIQGGICGGLTVTTANGSSGGAGDSLIFSWDLGDGTMLTGTNVEYTYTIPGPYTIVLTATDALCGDEATYQVDVLVEPELDLEELLDVPNVFTPNGDGLNDSFFPLPDTPGRVSLTVFNRWGRTVHESGSTFRAWNGSVRPGERAPDGVYFYLLEYDIPCGTVQFKGRKEGHVQLLR